MVLQFCMQEVTARPVSYRSGSRRPSVRAEKGTIRPIELKNQEIHVAVLEEGKRDASLNPIIKTHSQRLSTFFKNDVFIIFFNFMFGKVDIFYSNNEYYIYYIYIHILLIKLYKYIYKLINIIYIYINT